MSPRKPNNESSIYFGADGWWHGRVTMGVKNDGSAMKVVRPRRGAHRLLPSGWRPISPTLRA